jgi:hypothetical protein
MSKELVRVAGDVLHAVYGEEERACIAALTEPVAPTRRPDPQFVLDVTHTMPRPDSSRLYTRRTFCSHRTSPAPAAGNVAAWGEQWSTSRGDM